jgi:hypothetical protein
MRNPALRYRVESESAPRRAKGLKYERRFSATPSDFKEFNPTGQVPVLLADGRSIYDSTQILSEIRQWKLPEAAPTTEATPQAART